MRCCFLLSMLRFSSSFLALPAEVLEVPAFSFVAEVYRSCTYDMGFSFFLTALKFKDVVELPGFSLTVMFLTCVLTNEELFECFVDEGRDLLGKV